MIANKIASESIVRGIAIPELLKEESLADIFKETAKSYPDKTAIIFNKTSLTYAELDIWSNAIAADLNQRGIGCGKSVLVWLPRGLELHATILGIAKSGAAYVPVDREMPAERVEMVLAEVGAAACFSLSPLNSNATILSVIPFAEINPNANPTDTPLPDNYAYYLYTSGSTGKPKGIPITQRQICHLVRSENSLLKVQSSDLVYQGFSVSFDMWCEETWVSYLAGATIWVAYNATSKAIDELGKVWNDNKITVVHAVPSLLAVIEEEVPSIRLINSGGEACSLQVVNKWAKPGRIFYNSYGPTETTVSATFIELHPGDPITIGFPLPNYNVAVIDENKNIVPRGERGELIISGPGVSNGYVNLPELTAKKFMDNPFPTDLLPGERIYFTGDAAIINEDDSIDFLGRFDDQIKLRGYRIELGEIETRLHAQENVHTAAVAVKKDPQGQEHLIGYVLYDDEAVNDENHLRTELAKTLPSYMVPEAIVFLKEMPRMPSGKINRKELPVPAFFHTLSEEVKESIDINAPIEERIVAALHHSFPGKQIDLTQDFFTDLGGHSLLAAGFVSRLRREAGIPHASLKDVYLHRPLSALAKVWKESYATKEAPKRIFNVIPNWRYYTCWIAQTFASLLIFGLFTVQVFGPFVSYYYVSEETSNYFWGIVSAFIFFCLLPPVYTFIVVSLKWLVLGKSKEGDYPLWGSYYFRWWFVNSLQKLIPDQFFGGSPFYPFYLKLFGAKVASDAQLSSITIGSEDLITIGKDASLSSGVVLNNAYVEDGLFKLRKINIGDHSYIGSNCVIAGDTIIEGHTELQDMTHIPVGSVIKTGEVWYGSPGILKETKKIEDIPMPEYVSQRKRAAYTMLFSLILTLFPIFILFPLIPIIVSLHMLDNAAADYNFNYIIVVPALALLYMILYLMETVVFTRLLNHNIKPGRYSIYSMRYVRKWLSDQFMTLSLIVMHPIFASVYVSTFFRLLGARVGNKSEISTASSVTHSLLEIGDGCFVADAVTLGEADVRAQQLILDKTTIGNNSFVGNSALIPQGYRLPPNMLIGVLSMPPTAQQLQENKAADWFGSPSIALPQRQASNPFPDSLTTNPSLKRKIARGTVEFIRIILPETMIIISSIFFIAYGHDLIVDNPLWKIILLLPFYYLGFVGLPVFFFTVLLKWILVGKYKVEQHPMWTGKVWRSEAVTCTYESLSVPFLLDFLRGTPWLPAALRLMGTKIGRRVWLNTTDITEHDMVTIGTDTALNEDSGPQTHLFEDRVMKIGTVVFGERCSIGSRAIILYDTNIGNDVKIEPLSLVMKGEILSPGTSWIGSPVRPA